MNDNGKKSKCHEIHRQGKQIQHWLDDHSDKHQTSSYDKNNVDRINDDFTRKDKSRSIDDERYYKPVPN